MGDVEIQLITKESFDVYETVKAREATSLNCIPEISFDAVKNREIFAEGGSSRVLKAFYNGKMVAVKMLLPELRGSKEAVQDLHAELELVAHLRHKHIATLLAYGNLGKPSLFLVLEFCSQGTVGHRYSKKISALKCALALADALDYMHNEAVPGEIFIHRDLKPENIGMTTAGDIKIIDFGLSKRVKRSIVDSGMQKERYMMTGQTGSLRYMAPEVAKEEPYNETVDIYSWSMVTWQMVAKQKPLNNFDFNTFIKLVVEGGERPPLPAHWPAELCDLLTQCWDSDPDRRPDLQHIKRAVVSAIATLKSRNCVKSLEDHVSGMVETSVGALVGCAGLISRSRACNSRWTALVPLMTVFAMVSTYAVVTLYGVMSYIASIFSWA